MRWPNGKASSREQGDLEDGEDDGEMEVTWDKGSLN